MKMSRSCERFLFWNGYVREENPRYEPSCPKVGGSSSPSPWEVITFRGAAYFLNATQNNWNKLQAKVTYYMKRSGHLALPWTWRVGTYKVIYNIVIWYKRVQSTAICTIKRIFSNSKESSLGFLAQLYPRGPGVNWYVSVGVPKSKWWQPCGDQPVEERSFLFPRVQRLPFSEIN